MKIKEIIAENAIVKNNIKPNDNQEMSLQAAHRVAGTADRHYDLNRVMMCVAGLDGTNKSNTPKQSWAGRNNIAIPYTKIESNMLKQAYEEIGVDWDDILKPNLEEKSLESKDVNITSPVAKRTRNKYGV